MIRSLGPQKGSWAVYSFARKHEIKLTIPEKSSSIKAVFRLSDCTRPHEDIIKVWNILKSKELTLQLATKSGKTTLIALTPKRAVKYELGKLGRDKFSTLEMISDKGILLNGDIISTKVPKLPAKGKATIELHRNILYDLHF